MIADAAPAVPPAVTYHRPSKHAPVFRTIGDSRVSTMVKHNDPDYLTATTREYVPANDGTVRYVERA